MPLSPPSLNFAAASPVKPAAGAMRGFLHSALELILPQLCPTCCDTVDRRGLCAEWWSKLSFITRLYCERLGIPFVYDPAPGIRPWTQLSTRRPINRAHAVVRFDEISRALCTRSNMATG